VYLFSGNTSKKVGKKITEGKGKKLEFKRKAGL
jgi:hypothetical protein